MSTYHHPSLRFENIQVHNTRPALMSSADMSTAMHKDSQDISGTKATHSTTSRISPLHKSWLTKIKHRLTTDELLPTHQHPLIAGASGSLSQGQVTVLTGRSGSGKSVLLRVLAGLLPMTTGNVWLQDDSRQSGVHNDACYSINDIDPAQWRSQVALLAQHTQLIEGSVLDNLQMPYRLHAHQHSHFDIDWHIEQLACLERTADFLQQDARHLSGGERQLVNTLRLLQLGPQVLLLDEPTAALDTDTSAKLIQLLTNWLHGESTRAMLWVTHDTTDIMALTDKHWHMQAGILTEVL